MTYLPGSKLRMSSLDNKAKITSGVTADVFNVVEQNVIRLLNVCQPQTLFPAIFQNPMEKSHWL